MQTDITNPLILLRNDHYSGIPNELIIALRLFFILFCIIIATLATFFDMAITNGYFFIKQPPASNYHYIPKHSNRAHNTLASHFGGLSLKTRCRPDRSATNTPKPGTYVE